MGGKKGSEENVRRLQKVMRGNASGRTFRVSGDRAGGQHRKAKLLLSGERAVRGGRVLEITTAFIKKKKKCFRLGFTVGVIELVKLSWATGRYKSTASGDGKWNGGRNLVVRRHHLEKKPRSVGTHKSNSRATPGALTSSPRKYGIRDVRKLGSMSSIADIGEEGKVGRICRPPKKSSKTQTGEEITRDFCSIGPDTKACKKMPQSLDIRVGGDVNIEERRNATTCTRGT